MEALHRHRHRLLCWYSRRSKTHQDGKGGGKGNDCTIRPDGRSRADESHEQQGIVPTLERRFPFSFAWIAMIGNESL
jgi:hypothetical protein